MNWNKKVQVELTSHDKELLTNHIFFFLDNEIVNKLNHALLDGEYFLANLSVKEINCLLGFIAAEANHAENKDLEEEFDDLFLRLKEYID